ncbi:hypothetical protein CJO94_24130 (plasmid) [Ralstonia solanacearum]|nr:hypothetical protein CJO94_24130 [Ralstonia solanacearum]
MRPHFVTGAATKMSDRAFSAQFSMSEEVQAIAVRATDVISGHYFEMTLQANAGAWERHQYGRCLLTCLPSKDGGYAVSLSFELGLWPSGAWVLRFDAQVGGMWGHLENMRQDALAAGFLCDEGGRQVRSDELFACLSALTDRESLGVLSRVQTTMTTCYMQESWESMQWISGMWRALLSIWEGRISDAVPTLVDVACARPSEGANSSWMLQLLAGAAMPKIYSLPALAYGRVNQRAHSVAEGLHALAEVRAGYPRIFPDLVHVAAASGFSNLSEMMAGGSPRGFKLDLYVEALRQMGESIEDSFRLEDDSFRPAKGDWLGPVHYRFAMRALELAYEDSLAGNEIRRGQAIGLCRFAKQKVPVFPRNYHSRVAGSSPIVTPWQTDEDESLPEEVAQRGQNLEQIAHLISLLAFHCRLEARNVGELARFIGVLHGGGIPVEPSLTYILQIGEAMFAYYLLLWELVQIAENIQ